MAFLLVAPLAISITAPAQADSEFELLDLSKTVKTDHSGNRVEAGELFTYTLKTECSEQNCIDATIVDEFPPELDGFTLSNVQGSPSGYFSNAEIRWYDGQTELSGRPATLTDQTRVEILYRESLDGEDQGLPVGKAGTVHFVIQAPNELAPGEVTATNKAKTTAENSRDDFAEADIVLYAEEKIDVEPGKSWTPSTATNAEGTASTIELRAKNTSNIVIDELTIAEPAETGTSSELGENNPFRIADLAELDFSTGAPAGTTSTTLRLYVKDGNDWVWQEHSDLSGVDLSEVGGFEVTYHGTFEPGAEGNVTADLKLRGKDRNSDALLGGRTISVENTASATAKAEDHDPVTRTAEATYTVTPIELGVTAQKEIQPDRIGSGESTQGTVTVKNTSPEAVNKLTVSDLDFFDEKIQFGGFTSGIAYPEGATSGTALFYHDGDGSPTEVPFNNGDTPAAPGGVTISGFELVFTGEGDSITTNAAVTANFDILTNEGSHDDGGSLERTNTVTGTVEPVLGDPADATATADLTVIPPGITTTIDKKVHPTTDVHPGQPVVSELRTNTTVSSSYVKATNITIRDEVSDNSDFWNGFNLDAIPMVQIPAGTSGVVKVRVGDTWHEIDTFDAGPSTWTYSKNSDGLSTLLGGNDPALSASDIVGIEFDLTNPGGFSDDVTITPYLAFKARSDFRGGDPLPAEGETFKNLAEIGGKGTYGDDDSNEVTDADSDDDSATVVPLPGEEGIGVHIHKEWTKGFPVVAQSGQKPETQLKWGVSADFDTVTITDVPDPAADGASTVYDAFDLVELKPVAVSDTPFTNGWYLKYDSVKTVELYIDGSWEEVTAPSDGWSGTDGGFVGYTLTEDERAGATGVRYTLKPNDLARSAAQGEGGDAFAPEPNSGIIATSGTARTFDQVWQIRNVLRSNVNELVTDSREYNVADIPGSVDNIAGIEAHRGDDSFTDTDSAKIKITFGDMNVEATKSVADEELFIPNTGDRPGTSFTLTGQSRSEGNVTHLLLTDPPVCDDGATADGACHFDLPTSNPLESTGSDLLDAGKHNPFDAFNLTGITIMQSEDEADFDKSTVWLTHWDSSGVISSSSHTVTEANALNAGSLEDVIGIAVLFTTSDYETTGNPISQENTFSVDLDVQVRDTYRVSGDRVEFLANQSKTVYNRVAGYTYDANLAPEKRNFDEGKITTRLHGGKLEVTSDKSIDPSSLTEPTRDTPMEVTLSGDQGGSDLPTRVVTFVDDVDSSPEFWDAVDFTELGEITAPAGADQVQIDALVNGTWVDGTPSTLSDPVMPVAEDDFSDITGIRVIFSRADGELLSDSHKWDAGVAFTVTLRDTHRESRDPVEMSGSLDNTVTVISERSDGERVESESSAKIDLDSGSHKIDVVKNPEDGDHFVEVGETNTWTLEFTNTGTGYLTVESLVDEVPSGLRYTGEAITFSTSDGGTLSTDVTVDQDNETLTFTWPENGQRMEPGETFTVLIPLENTRALLGADRVTNPMIVTVSETLDECTNDSGNKQGRIEGLEDNQCGTTNYVQTVEGSNLYTVKGVKGALEGAFVPSNDDVECNTFVEPISGEPYFGPTCAANSEIGGVDDWILHNLNTGDVAIKDMHIFDQLPVLGDQQLVTGLDRGSDYRPVIDPDSITLDLPSGDHDVVLEFTTSSSVCVGTWTQVADPNGTICESSGETWVGKDQVQDWSEVTGLRAHIVFDGGLQPGQEANIRYSSTNVPNNGSNGGASVRVPVSDQFAWNQFGVRFEYEGDSQVRRLANRPVGVHLRTEELEITKELLGDAADAFAPEDFTADVACTIAGVDVDMGDYGTVTVTAGETTTVPGIPGGAVCTVTETGEVGEFGETSREGSPSTVTVDGDHDVVTLTNTYDYAGLNITKKIDPAVEDVDGTPVTYGPFDFALACTAPNGEEIDLGDASEFTLEAGETFSVPENTLPSGAECILTETNTGGAENVIFSGENVTADGTTATITVAGETDVEATVTNEFGSDVFEITKEITGPGKEYTSGEFVFHTTCEYNGEVLFINDERVLGAGETYTYGPLPLFTECTTTEVDVASATSTTVTVDDADPADGIEADATVGDTGNLTFTNVFELTEVEVEKVFGGPAGGFAGGVEVELACTWDGDGTTRVVDVADPVRTLTQDEPSTVFEGLPIGADCTVTEVDSAGAAGTVITVGEESVDGPSADVTTEVDRVGVEIDNTYEFGSLQVSKQVETDAAAGVFGPFDYELTCTTLAGDAVLWDGVPVLEFSLSDGDSFTVPQDTVPQNSTCVVRETGDGGAQHVSIVGDNVTEDGPGVASVFVGESAEVGFVNGFDTGVFTVAKEVTGPGAAYQTGEFEFAAVCEYNGGVVLDETFTLGDGESKTFGPFADGTVCQTEETADGGADEVTMSAADGTVTLGEEDTITVTNFFKERPELPESGVSVGGLAAGAGIILLAGAALLTVRRRNS